MPARRDDPTTPPDPPEADTASRPLNPDVAAAQDRFIATWGQMGSAWGISRTMAEVHALLYITGSSLCTDDVMERLSISRGNASMSLRALEDWGIIHRAHKRGDRKEYFQAESDVWVMFRTIARERKKRELDPLVQALFDIRDMTNPDRLERERAIDPDDDADATATDPATRAKLADERRGHEERLDSMLGFIERVDMLSKQVLKPGGSGLQRLLALLAKR